jgi:hypothetical protein
LGNYEKTKFDGWERYQAQTLLGAAVAGQNRFVEAEPLLAAGYEALVEHRATIPAESRAVVDQALAWIVELYQNWGKPEKASEWRRRRGEQ